MQHRNHIRIASGPLQGERLAVQLRVSTDLAPVATNQQSCCGHRDRKDVLAGPIGPPADIFPVRNTIATDFWRVTGPPSLPTLWDPHNFGSS